MEFHVIIPARYNSSRLPGKVLEKIGDKTMLEHVYQQAVDSGADSVVIATDDKKISDAAEAFGATVCTTASTHQSGTERMAEAVAALEYENDEVVVNLQADEPFLPSESIRQVVEDLLEHDNVKVSTLCEPIENPAELFDTHAVKVVMNRRNYAMYFSRATIPWDQERFKDQENITLDNVHFRHIGLYAYRAGFLQDYIDWATSPIETMEMLEQLRILWHGGRIHVCVSKKKIPPGVDTKEDLKKAREYFQQLKKKN